MKMNAKDMAHHLAMKFDDSKCQTDNAIECAKVAVNQLILEHTWKSPMQWNAKQKRYWEEVLTELNSL